MSKHCLNTFILKLTMETQSCMGCLKQQIPPSDIAYPFLPLFSVSCPHGPLFKWQSLTGLGPTALISPLNPPLYFTMIDRENMGIERVNSERLQGGGGGKQPCVEWEISQQRPDKVLPTHAVLSGCTASSASEVIT